jgi:hypothetical protein
MCRTSDPCSPTGSTPLVFRSTKQRYPTGFRHFDAYQQRLGRPKLALDSLHVYSTRDAVTTRDERFVYLLKALCRVSSLQAHTQICGAQTNTCTPVAQDTLDVAQGSRHQSFISNKEKNYPAQELAVIYHPEMVDQG